MLPGPPPDTETTQFDWAVNPVTKSDQLVTVSVVSTKQFMAFIDTGASNTDVAVNVIRSCNPMSRAKIRKNTAAGVVEVYAYSFWVAFQLKSEVTTGTEEMAFRSDGSEFSWSENLGFDVLLGRDIICKGKLVMSKRDLN